MISKYITKCPKCSSSRKKSDKASCSVLRFPNGLSYKCFHCGYKEFVGGKDQKVELGESVENIQVKEALIIPDGEYPIKHPDLSYHTYYRGKDPVMYVARKGSGDDKWIRPFILTEDGWIMEDTKGPFLYRSELLSDDNRPVLVVEGEKTADIAATRLTKVDVVTWKGGATNYKAGDWDLIKDRHVILWPDNDEAGISCMNSLAELLPNKHIDVINPSGVLKPKEDLGDPIPDELIKQLWVSRTKSSKPTIRGAISENVNSLFTNVEEGLSLGWPSLDKVVKLPTHGLVIIPGRTNHGKSLFQINLMANLLRQTSAACIYLSYEMPNEDIILRLIKTLNGTKYDPVGYKDDLVYKEKIRDGALPEVDEVNKYINSDRLFITDADISISEIEETVRYLHRLGRKIVVFLDYVQLIPSGAGRSERYLEVKHTVEKFRQLANELKMVVIGGSQLTSGETPFQDQARESKDIAFTAALIIKIWNKDSARVTGTVKMVQDPDNPKGEKLEEDYYNGTPGTFVAEIIKSRQGSLGATVGFNSTNGCKLVEANYTSKGGF